MKLKLTIGIMFLQINLLAFSGCQSLDLPSKTVNNETPANYGVTNEPSTSDIPNPINWESYFDDPNLSLLIHEALSNNQELNMVLQDIIIDQNEIRARKGEYLPSVSFHAGAGFDKAARYTPQGAVEHHLEVRPGVHFPEPVPDFMFGAYASWEVDVWKKLRNAKKAALTRYLATVEGKNFLITNIVAEIAESYYELIALDNMLEIINSNVQIQSNVFQVIQQQKEAAKVTQLAVNRFEAQVLNTMNLQFEVRQKIVETENKINFLVGRFPQPIERNSSKFLTYDTAEIESGLPSDLLEHRPDIRQANLQLAASKLDVKVAKANFYPSFGIQSGIGFQAFNPSFLINPASLLYGLAGDLMAPLVNRNAIKAVYYNANAKQIQAIYDYERTILQAYVDVVNQLNKVENYNKSFDIKSKEVALLNKSTAISNNLFNAARADYMEVLLTQREALEANMELLEIKLHQLHAKVSLYRALGGGV
ncbi:TolC family protein [Belliella kenyensis]|uniref:TolC family protein n=1 Tax=Belliella kenyensis TaxID=1472724 RepID=A0ABV8EGS7_9BACT|nr:efflux transporter outer membrane subunit [Belliella kenyensis]MCH7401179.1 efflux transporter outer membrane subunit [Belliella kenyensis]MDN3604176.1 efflux transporter outer membrane subunit [Belliella kenyensis]